MADRSGSQSPTDALFDLIFAQRTTAAIYAATRLGIADILADGPKSPSEVARWTGAHHQSLRRLLRALVSVGVCTQVSEDQFELTAAGRHLAGGSKPSLRAWAIFETEFVSQRWESLLEAVRSGKSADGLARRGSSLSRSAANPETVSLMNEAMVAFTSVTLPAVLTAYDFSGIDKIIDVGGGYGESLTAILKTYPSMRGVVFDLPRCAEGARKHLAQEGLADRAEFIAGDFFESLPTGADALFIKSVIHNWDDERSFKILRNCQRALPASHGKLLLVERLMPPRVESNPDHFAVVMSDLMMLLGGAGRERTEEEHRALLTRAGFFCMRTLPAGRLSVIEATRA